MYLTKFLINYFMRKILFYASVACVMAAFASCSESDEPTPGAAGAIVGAHANECPVATVGLSIGAIENAVSYEWYKNGTPIPGATTSNYTVTETGTYAVAGVNTAGIGPKSANHVVTITPCGTVTIEPPAAAGAITGATENVCPAVTVVLTIGAIERAESYVWYKNNTAIPGATLTTYTVTESGVYKVAGQNTAGFGDASANHEVTIKECEPAPAGAIIGAHANDCPSEEVELTVGAIAGATSYKWYKDGAEIVGAIAISYTVTESGVYKVAGVNAIGEGDASPNHEVTITTPCTGDVPDAAGAISGAHANVCPSVEVNLTIGAINGATSYQWYKDGTPITGATAMNYTVTEVGTYTYTVAGVNGYGAGEKSPNHEVAITPCVTLFIDQLVGDWDYSVWIENEDDEWELWEYTVPITKVNNTTIHLEDFPEEGLNVNATIDNEDKTLTVFWQKAYVIASRPYDLWVADFTATNYCTNMGLDLKTVEAEGSPIHFEWHNTWGITIDGVRREVGCTYLAIDDVDETICYGGFGVVLDMQMTKATKGSKAVKASAIKKIKKPSKRTQRYDLPAGIKK